MGSMTELQTMPLRFRVWDKCSEQFYQIKDAYPELPGLTDEFKNCSEFDLMDLASLDRSLGGISKDDNFIISQDTGVLDSNKKPIFTGDIVRVKGFGQDSVGVVEYHKGECRIYYENGLTDSLVFNVGREVIGNIWEKDYEQD